MIDPKSSLLRNFTQCSSNSLIYNFIRNKFVSSFFKAPRAWMNQVTTLYDTPLKMTYKDLDPNATYKLKVAYTGRFRSKMKLVADNKYLIHDFIQTGIIPIHEFDIPLIATKDGVLELSWTCGEGQRGSQVAEIWLMRK